MYDNKEKVTVYFVLSKKEITITERVVNGNKTLSYIKGDFTYVSGK